MDDVRVTIVDYARSLGLTSPINLSIQAYSFDTTDSILDRIEARNQIPKGLCVNLDSSIIPFVDTERHLHVVDLMYFFRYVVLDGLDENVLEEAMDLLLSDNILSRISVRCPDISDPTHLILLLYTIFKFEEEAEFNTESLVEFIKADEESVLGSFEEVCIAFNKDSTGGIDSLRQLGDYLEKWLVVEYPYGNMTNPPVTLVQLRQGEMRSFDNEINAIRALDLGELRRTEDFSARHIEYLSEVSFPIGTRLLEIFDAMNMTDDIPYARVVYHEKKFHKVKRDMLHRKELFGNSQLDTEGDGIFFRGDIGRRVVSTTADDDDDEGCDGEDVEIPEVNRTYGHCSLVRDEHNTKIRMQINPMYVSAQGASVVGSIEEDLLRSFGSRIRLDTSIPTRQSGVKGCMIYSNINFSSTLFASVLSKSVALRYLFFVRDFGNGNQKSTTLTNAMKSFKFFYEPNHEYDTGVTKTSVIIKRSLIPGSLNQISVTIKSELTTDQIAGVVKVIDLTLRYYASEMNRVRSWFVRYANVDFDLVHVPVSKTAAKKVQDSIKSGLTLKRLQDNRPNLFGGNVKGMTCKGGTRSTGGEFYSAKCQACKNRQPWLIMTRAELDAFIDANAEKKSPVYKQKLFYEAILPFPKDGNPNIRASIPEDLSYDDTSLDHLLDWYVCPTYISQKNVKTMQLKEGVVVADKTKFPSDSLKNNIPGGFPLTFPCCFTKTTQNQNKIRPTPKIITTQREHAKYLKANPTASSKKYGDAWFVVPEAVRTNLNAKKSYKYDLKGLKLLPNAKAGSLPPNVEFVMTESIASELTIRRAGVEHTPSSFFVAVYSALIDKFPHMSTFSDFVGRLYTSLQNEGIPLASKQSTFDYTAKDLLDIISDKSAYKDPMLWGPILEEVFEINIFLFKMDPKTPEGDVVLPRHSNFYVPKELWYSESIVIIMDAIRSGLPYPYQSEFVKVNTSKKHGIMVIEYVDVGGVHYSKIIDNLIKYTLLKANSLHFSPNPNINFSHSQPGRNYQEFDESEESEDEYVRPIVQNQLNFDGLDQNKRDVRGFLKVIRDKKDDEDVIEKIGTYLFTRENIYSRLIGGDWLDDEVVNYTLENIERQVNSPSQIVAKTYYAGNPRWIDRVLKGDKMSEPRNLRRLMGDRDWRNEGVEKIIVPFNIVEPAGHWILLVIDLKKDEIKYYDSLFPAVDTKKERARHVKGVRDAYVSILSTLFPNKKFNFFLMGVPQQEDAVNCGMFTIMFGDDVIHGRRVSKDRVNMREMRWRLAIQILQHKLITLK